MFLPSISGVAKRRPKKLSNPYFLRIISSRKIPSFSQDVQTLAKDLKEEYQLSDYESLKLALNAEHNEILKLAFVIDSSNHTPNSHICSFLHCNFKCFHIPQCL